MSQKKYFSESELAALAKKVRIKSGKTKIQAAQELGVSRPSVQLAEETPEQSLTNLRCRIIETFSSYKVVGPFFMLKRK